MLKSRYFCGGSAMAVVMAFGLAQAAVAAEAKPTAEVSEVVVTGSYIAGTPEDSALPVDVLSNDVLQKQGSPTAVQLVKTLTASTSGLGESNRYNGGAGTASINLRGFGASRTLTLMNGRRLADSAQGCYALIDYVNFKGEGVLLTERYQGRGWGLLQVLEGMSTASDRSPTAEFAESAARILRERAENAPPERNEQRWLSGWLNRVASYR